MTKSPHFWWIICLLSAIIIGLVSFIITQRCVDSAALIAYIGVCSTLLSITLSIIAIQYTYHSNIDVSKQFKEINATARNINTTSKDLTKLSGVIEGRIKDVFSHLRDIADTQASILDEVKNRDIHTSSTNDADNIDETPIQQTTEVKDIEVDVKQRG
jgi:hypothetical protein